MNFDPSLSVRNFSIIFTLVPRRAARESKYQITPSLDHNMIKAKSPVIMLHCAGGSLFTPVGAQGPIPALSYRHKTGLSIFVRASACERQPARLSKQRRHCSGFLLFPLSLACGLGQPQQSAGPCPPAPSRDPSGKDTQIVQVTRESRIFCMRHACSPTTTHTTTRSEPGSCSSSGRQALPSGRTACPGSSQRDGCSLRSSTYPHATTQCCCRCC